MKSNGIKRGIKSQQVNLREINLQINGLLATPTATGFDEFGVSEVIDGGTGLITIVLNRPFLRSDVMVKSISMITADATASVVATAADRVTIQAMVAGVDADADYFISILGSDFKNKV